VNAVGVKQRLVVAIYCTIPVREHGTLLLMLQKVEPLACQFRVYAPAPDVVIVPSLVHAKETVRRLAAVTDLLRDREDFIRGNVHVLILFRCSGREIDGQIGSAARPVAQRRY
jgi:hypothetical protein